MPRYTLNNVCIREIDAAKTEKVRKIEKELRRRSGDNGTSRKAQADKTEFQMANGTTSFMYLETTFCER
jgi:hypothetical protein